MKKYILYVNVGNMAKPKAKQYMKDMGDSVRESGILDPDDKLLLLPSTTTTELVFLPS